MKLFLGILVAACYMSVTHAQELNCNVTVNAPQLRLADPQIFKNLETAIYEFMNNRKWTDDQYEPNEKINCNIIISVTKENSIDDFDARISVQSGRPVFNSDYQTSLFNHVDKDVHFNYTGFEPMEFVENSNVNNLTSILAFYAYVIIGYDYDSFGEKSGTPYFLKAQDVVNAAQSSGPKDRGWKAFDGTRNRYWLANNLTNPKYADFRSAFYNYHIKGLDVMYDEKTEATKVVLASLNKLNGVNRLNPNSMLMQVFFASKKDELIKLFKGSQPSEKVKAMSTLVRMDPANSEEYQGIIK